MYIYLRTISKLSSQFAHWSNYRLALRAERQSVRMSEIKNGRLGLYDKVQQFEQLSLKG